MVDKKIIGQVPKSIKNLRIFNRIFNLILCILIIPIVIINVVMFIKSLTNKEQVPDFLGYKFFVVLTGSMQPTLNEGDFIVSKEADLKKLKVGDIISFKEEKAVITHRIVKIDENDSNAVYTTKGDYNNTEDEQKVEGLSIEGKYMFKLSGIGKILLFFQSIWGIIILILIPVISIIFSYTREDRVNMKKAMRKSKRIAYNKREIDK